MRIPSGVTDQYIYFVAVDATDLKTRETGLSSFTVYRSRNGAAAAAMTTPTVNETDATNMPGVYELLLDEDMTIGSGNDSEEMIFHITQASMTPVTRAIELYRPKITAGNTLDVTATGAAGIDWNNVENPTTTVDLSNTSINLCDTITTYTGNTVQTGDSYAIVNSGTFGNAQLVRATTPANTLDISATGEAGIDWANIGSPTTVVDLSGTTSTQLVDDVWDEILTGATHNIPTSAGRRLRTLQDFGLYEGGAVWVDTVNGTPGTTDFENGTVTNPVDTIADAKTIADSIGLTRFQLISGSSITLAASYDTYTFIAYGATIALGGQSLNGTFIEGATITGNDDGSNTIPTLYRFCEFGNSTFGQHIFEWCHFTGNITLAEAGDYLWDHCSSFVAGNGTPDITFSTGNQALSVRHYSGGMEINSMAAGDTMSYEGFGQFKIAASCTGGTVSIRGTIGPITDAASGAVTLTENARIADDTINAQVDLALSDYDGPTNTEMTAAFTEIKGATWSSGTDTLEHIRDKQTDIETDTQDIQTQIGTAGAGLTDLGGMSTGMKAEVESEVNDALVAQKLDHLVAVADADDAVDNSIVAKLASTTADWSTFVSSTDALQSIRDRGDAAWTTGAGGTPPHLLQTTTIATLATQTSFTLTAGSADDNAYNGGIVVVTDQSTSTQKAVGEVSAYTGATKTVTLAADPGIFTMAVGDTIDIMSALGSGPTAAAIVNEWETQSQADPTGFQVNVMEVNGTAQTANDNGADINAILVDTAEIGVAGAGLTNINLPNQTMDITGSLSGNVGGIAGTITTLDALDTAQDTQHSTTQSSIAALNDVAATDIVSAGAITTLAGAVVNVDLTDTCTTNTDMRGTDNAFLAASAPTNFSDLAITVTTGLVSVGTNSDKTGYSISGSITTLDGLNDPTAVEVADAFLDRDMSTGTDSGSSTVRTPRQALRFLRNYWDVSGTTLTVRKEDDATTSWTGTVTTNASADPITGSNPTGGS